MPNDVFSWDFNGFDRGKQFNNLVYFILKLFANIICIYIKWVR